MDHRALPSFKVRLIGERVNTGCIDPSIVKVEERAYGNCKVDRLSFQPALYRGCMSAGVMPGDS